MKIYSMSNIVILDHNGLFIYFDISYLKSPTMMWTFFCIITFIDIVLKICIPHNNFLEYLLQFKVHVTWNDHYVKDRETWVDAWC